MASVKELLLNSLRDLLQDDLKLFQWLLNNNHECISRSEMQNADVLKTVDTIVACFGPEEAVKITVEILRKINHNNLAEQLEKTHKKVSLCDIKQHPERNNSDTHTTGFSNHKKHLEKEELRMNNEADKAQFFNNNWTALIKRVNNIGNIADKLLLHKIINEGQYSEITHDSLTSEKSMRKICDIIRKHSDPVKAEFISILQEEERFLLEHWSDSPP